MQKPKDLTRFLSGVTNTEFQNVKDRTGKQFSVKLGKPDPQDRKYDLLKNIITPGTKDIPVPQTKDGLVPVADDEYYQYISRKVDAELEANFEGWVMNQVDFSSPEKYQHWTRIAPFVQAKREAVLNEQAELQKRLALIKMRGPESEDDLKLLFAFHTGLVNVANAPLYKLEDDKITFEGKKTGPSSSFTAGLLSPWRSYFHNNTTLKPLIANSTVGAINFTNPIGALDTTKTAEGSFGTPVFQIRA